MKDKKSSAMLHVLTPFIVTLLVVGAAVLAMIKPSDKLKVYFNLAFMDDLKTDPTTAGSGLVIRQNEIIEDYSGETSSTGDVIRPQFGEMYAHLSGSSLSLTIPVYWGTNPELLEMGACQSGGSKLPGEGGNTVISAHEDTYFSELSSVKPGDTITINTNYGEFVYTVSETISFVRTDKRYLQPTEDSRLTLYTCKKDVLSSSDERIGVVCTLTEAKFYTGGEQ
ncbi:MAG: class D sortase [Ruminococcus sp.]|nr:class D sortase [Ruminococcus sp.]